MRHLVGTGHDGGIPDAVELPLVAEGLARPAEPDDVERLAEAGLALAIRHAVDVVRPHDATAADAELQAPRADVIERGDLLGDAPGTVQRQHLHGGAHAQPPGAGGEGAGHLQGGGDDGPRRREVDLAEPHAVGAPGLGAVGQLEHVAEGGRLVRPLPHLLDEDPEVHGLPPSPLARAIVDQSRAPFPGSRWSRISPGERPMARLDGKVALISGGARGQGAAEAETFVREGARVVFGDVRDDEGKKVEAGIRAAGGDAVYVHLDVTSELDWQAAVRTAVERYGRLDILVNNAAIVIPRVPIEERTVEEWDRVMAVNARGVFLGTKHCIPAMRRAGGGSIVNISSVAGIGQSLHQEPAYAASKGAIRIFTKVTASQHAKDGIRCNSVHPGPVDTEMFHSAFQDKEAMQRRLERVPLRRMGTVAEIVTAVLYLASDESSYMTGSELVIDGGALAQ